MCVQGWGTQFIAVNVLGCTEVCVLRFIEVFVLGCIVCVPVCTKVYCSVLKCTEVLCTGVH